MKTSGGSPSIAAASSLSIGGVAAASGACVAASGDASGGGASGGMIAAVALGCATNARFGVARQYWLHVWRKFATFSPGSLLAL